MQFLQGSTWRGRSGGLAGAVLFLLVGSAAARGETFWYVDDDAPPGGDGLTWATGYQFLQDALAVAQAGDEIHTAQGTYYPDEDEANPAGTGLREATFQLPNGVTMLGGFAGLEGEDPDDRDPDWYPTILSGDLEENDEPDFVSYDENSYHVVTASGVSATAVLDGFTIQAGFAEARDGGGIFCESGSPAIRDCTLRANLATGAEAELAGLGGGMYGTGVSAPTLDTCSFIGNKVVGEYALTGVGGAAAFQYGCSPILNDCAFIENLAVGLVTESGYWAGVYCSNDVTAEFIDCTFTRNEASSDEWNAGAGAGVGANYDSVLTLTRCVFEENLSNAITAIYVNDNIELHLKDCRFRANTCSVNPAGYGGIAAAVTVGNSIATIDGCEFEENVAEVTSGALYLLDSETTITNSTFTGNTAAAGVLFIYGPADTTLTNVLFSRNQAEHGGAIRNLLSSPVLTNVTFAHNTATTEGGGVYNTTDSHPSFRNAIFWGNTGGQIVDSGISSTTVEFSNVEGGWPGLGNIDADPLFVDPDHGNLRLGPCSPCIDAADNDAVPEGVTEDLDGNPRFVDDPATEDTGIGDPPVVDMGPYEFQLDRVRPSSVTMIEGIVDGGDVDSVCGSDGDYLNMRPNALAAVLSPAPIQVQFDGTYTGAGDPTMLTVNVEVAAASAGTVLRLILIRADGTEDSYVLSPSLPTTDTLFSQVADEPAANYIGPDGEISLRVENLNVFGVPPAWWPVLYDRVEWFFE